METYIQIICVVYNIEYSQWQLSDSKGQEQEENKMIDQNSFSMG